MIAPNLTPMLDGEDGTVEHLPQPRSLPFPPLTKKHILNCAYNSWWPQYRAFVPKSRIIPLTQPFVDYLQADGIYLPADEGNSHPGFEEDTEDATEDVAKDWRPLHEQIKATIKGLGGKVLPKLNWSSPKDATHMLGNTMDCYSADDVYLLLKSSDFISFDLNHAFDETVDDPNDQSSIPWHLVLRKSFNMSPSVEFRCFVKEKRLIGATQRDMNYYNFLHTEKDIFMGLIEDFFEDKLKDTFPEDNYVFDAYIPNPYTKVWLIDINPWAQRTDPLLFSWLELLTMEVPAEEPHETIRLQLASTSITKDQSTPPTDVPPDEDHDADSDDEIEEIFVPELRLLNKDDPEAFAFASQQYSAHKMPKDVVDAATTGDTNALRELSMEWQDALSRARAADERSTNDEDE